MKIFPYRLGNLALDIVVQRVPPCPETKSVDDGRRGIDGSVIGVAAASIELFANLLGERLNCHALFYVKFVPEI